jgi:hypothetical protein
MIEYDGYLVENICPICLQEIDVNDPGFYYPLTRICCDKHVDLKRIGCIEAAGGCGLEYVASSLEDCIEGWNYLIEKIKNNLERRGVI